MFLRVHLHGLSVVYVVVEKTSTRPRSRIPCVVVKKITTRRREDGVVIVGDEYKKSTNFGQKHVVIDRQGTNGTIGGPGLYKAI